ncbi:NAD(P)-dependent alcohol dehydrogenase [Lysinibacter cavernae]|uniref:L-iditol 2-dehydrogenase n=1 Tax=Lysinibacter cavernae TaxID=1640652 RepID=A0A7X5R1N0_9MICO|nr:NAD(P)-dependent alcohol dehydrogenase [Lysinibacter cavernae]NIH53959.1 L-iditol 2-dehydrogenase [Lysinibacter cavernae]
MATPLPTTMRASVLVEQQQIRLDERPVPTPDADQVLVKVTAVGVCGSDVHFYHDGRLGDFVIDAPLVLGHESAGIIVAVGSNVDPARIGSRVSVEPQRPDLTSRESLEGNYNLDPHMEFYATPPIDGAFAEYVTIQSHFAFDVPDSISDEAAALIEPLSVGIAAIQKAKVTAGSRILIAGAGPIGVITAQVARAYGALEIIVSDLSETRREQALRYGATSVIDPRETDLSTLGVDAFIECSGAAAAISTGMRAVRPAGIVVLVGMGPTEVPLSIPLIQNNELVVTGIFRYKNTWPLAIELLNSGKIDLDSLVTGRFGLDEVDAALNSTADETALKSVVIPTR